MKILLVVGARPNIIKIAPIFRSLSMNRNEQSEKYCSLSWKVVHTGQHYDYEMSKVFFDQLEITKPDYFLKAGSGSHATQTAKIMIEFENVCVRESPDIVVVVGDVNSTLACSIVAKKYGARVAHVEAGLRSWDMKMPEEINRIVTDSISDYCFVTEKSGIRNLKQEGKKDSQIFFVGNVMIDTLFHQLEKIDNKKPLVDVPKEPFATMTLHRPSNVDCQRRFTEILVAAKEISKEMPVLFPVHPRTMKNIDSFGLMKLIEDSNVRLLLPLPYMEFLALWKNSCLVLTDSGGIQEETTALGIPCFTIRNNTERPITIEEGTNRLVGTTRESILRAFSSFKKDGPKIGKVPELWDGRSAERIVDILYSQGTK